MRRSPRTPTVHVDNAGPNVKGGNVGSSSTSVDGGLRSSPQVKNSSRIKRTAAGTKKDRQSRVKIVRDSMMNIGDSMSEPLPSSLQKSTTQPTNQASKLDENGAHQLSQSSTSFFRLKKLSENAVTPSRFKRLSSLCGLRSLEEGVAPVHLIVEDNLHCATPGGAGV